MAASQLDFSELLEPLCLKPPVRFHQH